MEEKSLKWRVLAPREGRTEKKQKKEKKLVDTIGFGW